MAEISSESQFFSGNIANMIPEGPLNKMVPLTEDHGGGGGGGGVTWGPPLAHGLLELYLWYWDKEHNVFWIISIYK